MPDFVKLATLEELPPGRSKEVEHEGRIFALFNVDGTISAIDGLCPHGWEFCVRDGKSTLNSKLKQPVFEVKVDGQDILVAVNQPT